MFRPLLAAALLSLSPPSRRPRSSSSRFSISIAIPQMIAPTSITAAQSGRVCGGNRSPATVPHREQPRPQHRLQQHLARPAFRQPHPAQRARCLPGHLHRSPSARHECLPLGLTPDDARNEAYANVPRYFIKRDLMGSAVLLPNREVAIPAQAPLPGTLQISPATAGPPPNRPPKPQTPSRSSSSPKAC